MESTPRMRLGLPDLGVGVGLRIPHYRHIFEHRPRVDWFEIISENFMVDGGMPIANLERALESYRVVQHGVSLSIGSPDPLDFTYLRRLKALLAKVKSPWVSDHLCWTGAHGRHLHDLLPLPYTEEVVRYVAARARVVQDFLEVRLALENVSSYLTFTTSRMTEWEFLSAVAEEADCGILLDVNNVYVSAYNHGFDPEAYIDGVPHHRIVQFHLAGHTNHGKYILDTHNHRVIDAVWALYRRAISHTGNVSTLLEWDDDIPPFEEVVAEAEKARAIREEVAAGGRVGGAPWRGAREGGPPARPAGAHAPEVGTRNAPPTPRREPGPPEAPPPAWLAALMGELTRVFTSGAPLPDDPALAARCRAHVAGSARLTPAEQADIYRRQFWVRHLDALREDYPALAHVLGDDGFDAFCRAYLVAHPPDSFTLRDLGNHVVAFAAAYDGFPPALRELARDTARYEHALVTLFDGAAPPPLDPAKVTDMPADGWTTARLVLHPLLELLRLRYPVHLLRSELRQGRKPALPAPRPVHLAVFRRASDLTVRYEELDPLAFSLLEALGRGVPLVAACEAVAAGVDAEAGAALAARVGAWFQQWTRTGLIVDVVRGEDAEAG